MAARIGIRIGVDVVVKAACTAGLSSVFACWWYRPAVDRRDGQGTRRAAGMSAIDYHDVSSPASLTHSLLHCDGTFTLQYFTLIV